MAVSTRTQPFAPAASPAPRDASLRFDAAVVLAALWFIGGLLVDGWAHNHLDLSREGFFTPYHALFYSGFVAIGAVILIRTYRNTERGSTWRAAIPRGYDLTLAGLAIFAVGGVLDMLWHIFFGIEQDVAALFSPTHLLLAVGIASILSGPIRSVIARDSARSFRTQWPGLVALALIATLVLFFFMWAFGIGAAAAGAPHALYPQLTGDALAGMYDDRLEHGITAVAFRSLLMAGVVLWAGRRLALPAGAATLLLVVPNTLVGAMLDPAIPWIAPQFLSALAAGAVAEVCLARGVDLRAGGWSNRAFAFAIPFAFWTVYLTIAEITSGGLWWNVHVIAGAPVIGGLIAVLFEIVSEPRTASHLQPPGEHGSGDGSGAGDPGDVLRGIAVVQARERR